MIDANRLSEVILAIKRVLDGDAEAVRDHHHLHNNKQKPLRRSYECIVSGRSDSPPTLDGIKRTKLDSEWIKRNLLTRAHVWDSAPGQPSRTMARPMRRSHLDLSDRW